MKTLLIGTLLLAPLVVLANDTSAGIAPEGVTPTRLLARLHYKNQAQARYGSLAQTQAGVAAKVKAYGEGLVKSHGRLDQAVLQYAEEQQIVLPPTPFEEPTAAKQASFDRLRALQGRDFDQAFLSKMIESSQRMVTFLEAARPQQSDQKLRALLDKAAAAFKADQREAENLLGEMPAT